jgi:hypothetical protein
MESLQRDTVMHHNFRRDFFFWLGVVILPAFWSWFTLGRRHSKAERGLAFGWLVLFAAIIFLTWPEMAAHCQFALANLQFICLAVGGALGVWLVLRGIYRTGCPSFIDMVIFCWMIAILSGSPGTEQELEKLCLQPLGLIHAMAILVPASLHFTLDLVKKRLDEPA